ncbi:lipid storage droplets surface-binding protein 2-like [Cephus cinctus]|uniref:Lipid storage droplets surface-binding protein 2-like n=1 Tax=Cephus cinctus TaxID=211228 RepID=A0AAJ7RU19_CEPCN|nr:lipid storage droplets surface-binding protein 2-like [Cephus cinctus]
MAAETVELPQMAVLNRVLGLPMIELALSKSASTYTRVKDSHQLLYWALSTAETSLTNATKQAVPLAIPIAKKFEAPIHFVDHTLCMGLDKIEEKVPIVHQSPEKILENAYVLALQTVQPAVSTIYYANELITTQATSLKDLSWNKMNQLLSSHYGTVAVNSLDSTAAIVDKLIDQYFPAAGDEKDIALVSAEEDKLLHTLQTVGRLSNKAARRVYSSVIRHLKTIKTDDLKEYISSLVQFLQLTHYIQVINEKVQTFTAPPKETHNQTKH